MPKKLEDCVRDVKAKGEDVDPWAVCVASTGEKPHSESIEETVMRQVLDASAGENCKCQKKKTY